MLALPPHPRNNSHWLERETMTEAGLRPRVIAHRGVSALAPENTLAAYEAAVERGADYVEIDVRMTRDDELVCMHDEYVNRTTSGTGPVRELCLEQLERLDAGSWFYRARPAGDRARHSAPTLGEAVDLVGGRCGLCVELKQPWLYPSLEERVIELLGEYGVLEDKPHYASLIVQSFNADGLRKVAALAPHVTRCQLIPPGSRLDKELLEEVGSYAQGVAPHLGAVTPQLVEEAHGLGLFIHPYTINSPREMHSLLRMGVDGLIGDNPSELGRAVREQVELART